MEYINKTGLTHLKGIIRQETKTEIEKATNKVLPINFYKFSNTNEMFLTDASDGDIGIFCGEVEEGVFKNTSFKNIIIKDTISIFEGLSDEAKSYCFYNQLSEKVLEVIISSSEIKIIVHGITKTFIYEPDISGENFILISGEPGQINFSSNIFFPTYKNENDWNIVLSSVLTCRQKKVEVYIYNENTIYGNNWEKITTIDNDYVTEDSVEFLVQQTVNKALGNNNS